jgi:hypothetical protein
VHPSTFILNDDSTGAALGIQCIETTTQAIGYPASQAQGLMTDDKIKVVGWLIEQKIAYSTADQVNLLVGLDGRLKFGDCFEGWQVQQMVHQTGGW